MLLMWDNLAGHRNYPMMDWLFQHGIMPLYTPLSGSWLNMAESSEPHPGPPGLVRSIPAKSATDHRVVRADGGWLERGSHPVRVAWEATRAPPARMTEAFSWLWGCYPRLR